MTAGAKPSGPRGLTLELRDPPLRVIFDASAAVEGLLAPLLKTRPGQGTRSDAVRHSFLDGLALGALLHQTGHAEIEAGADPDGDAAARTIARGLAS